MASSRFVLVVSLNFNKQLRMVNKSILSNGLKISLTIVFLITSQLFVKAQVKQEQFLIKVGVKDSLYSQVLNESRTIYIELPADYDPTKSKKYPVAYILDGEVFLPTLSDVQSYYSGGFTPEMILVGISNAKNRTRDLTISKVTEREVMP